MFDILLVCVFCMPHVHSLIGLRYYDWVGTNTDQVVLDVRDRVHD